MEESPPGAALLRALGEVLHSYAVEHDLDYDEVMAALRAATTEEQVPLAIFRVRTLGPLETLARYLREERGLRLSQVARLLRRDPRTVWSAYTSSLRKHPRRLAWPSGTLQVPASVFADRRLGPLEALTFYLRERKRHSYAEIGRQLNRDARTVWTACRRARGKTGGFG